MGREKRGGFAVKCTGFHVFRDDPDAVHLLIIADRKYRIARMAESRNISPEEADKLIDSIDRSRDTFVKTVANTSRYDARNYDFVFNVSGIAPEKVASFLAENIRHKLAMKK